MLVNIVLAVVIFFNQNYYSQVGASWAKIIQWISLLMYLLWLAMQFYAIPYFLLQEKRSLLLAWRNSLYTLLAFPVYSLVIILLCLVFLLLSFALVIPALLGVPLIVVVAASAAVRERLQKLNLLEDEDQPAGESEG